MNKLEMSHILVKNAKLKSVKLSDKDVDVVKLITETKKKQAEVLKLKQVDKDRLRMVVQL